MTYRFHTKITKEGIIRLPSLTSVLLNKEVEITISAKTVKKEKKGKAIDFIKNWGGFLKNDKETDILKSDYLDEKYK